MPVFEYSEWDGSQQFTPLSAEAAFDKLSEYLLEHGEYILRQLDRKDRDDADLLKLLIKEGYLEKDEKGRLSIAPRGVRRIEDKALNELFLINQKGNLAKKVALALASLIRGRYAEDALKIIGFYTYASPLTERGLLRAGPKPVSIFDSRVFLRVPLDYPPEFVPEHFTNIQAGLRFARS